MRGLCACGTEKHPTYLLLEWLLITVFMVKLVLLFCWWVFSNYKEHILTGKGMPARAVGSQSSSAGQKS